MTPSFDEVMHLTRTISSPTAFDDQECAAYYNLAAALPPGSTIVEIGLQYGRSSSIVMQIAAAANHLYLGVDPFTEPPEARVAWVNLAMHICAPRAGVLLMRSDEVTDWPSPIDLALIDGDHEEAGVRIDCGIILPRIAIGGHVAIHDYGRASLPGVWAGVNASMTDNLTLEGIYGSLGVWRRDS